MTKVLSATILGALLLFAWGMFSWMVLPWHKQTIHTFKFPTTVVAAMKTNATESGIYVLPAFEKVKKGEIPSMTVFASVHHAKMASMNTYMLKGFLIQLLSAFLMALLVCKAKVESYFCKVVMITLIGVLAGIQGYLPAWNWWHFSMEYTLVEIADMAIGWYIAALVMAKIL